MGHKVSNAQLGICERYLVERKSTSTPNPHTSFYSKCKSDSIECLSLTPLSLHVLHVYMLVPLITLALVDAKVARVITPNTSYSQKKRSP
jgi:hypothetical protein